MSHLPIAIAVLIVAGFLFLVFKHGGLKGAFLGGRIRRTVGRASGANQLGFETSVVVHTLESPDPNRAVALTISTAVGLDFTWTPVTVSKDQALRLSELLREAASDAAA